MAAENILQTLQRLATTSQRIDTLHEALRDFDEQTSARLTKLEDQMADVRERLARLETAREADHAQIQANLAQFKAEVERAQLRLGQLPS